MKKKEYTGYKLLLTRIEPRVLILILFITLQACEERMYTTIPNVRVNITLDLDFEDYELNAALATKSFTQPRRATDEIGFGGILVINAPSADGSIVNLFAYDLACPVEIDREKIVIPNEIGEAKCPHCGAIYNIASGYGYPKSGTKSRLRAYSVTKISGGNRYLIRN